MQSNHFHSDKDLLKQVAAGSESAFSELFRIYRGKLYHYILAITKSQESAEDAVHDVFLKIWEDRQQLAVVEHPASYIYRMCYNHAITGLRRKAKEILILAEITGEISKHSTEEMLLDQKEIRFFIQQAVEKLSPQQRKVFVMSRQDGLKHKEIAMHLGISINTVRTHMADALRLLRDEIEQSYGSFATAIWVIYGLS